MLEWILLSPYGEFYNASFSVLELQTALFQFHDLSPWPDDVPYAFLRNMSHTVFIWRTGVFPCSWGVEVVLSIPKPEMDNLQPTNYRPISLTSCVLVSCVLLLH